MMQGLSEIVNTTGFKIGIAVSFMCLVLFGLLNFVVINNSRSSFLDVLEGAEFQLQEGTQFGDYTGKDKLNILKFYLDQVETAKPLQDQFVEDFQASLLWILSLGVASSFLIGFIASKVFTRPLNQLSAGMKKLRKNDYRIELERIGTEEFDIVIDEFNCLTQELQRIEDLRKDLISDTSHELKTPLTSLYGQLEGIRDGVLEPDKKRMENLLSQVSRLSDLVERLQEFSRLRNKSYNIEMEKFNFKSFIDSVFQNFQKDLETEKIGYSLQFRDKFVVKADRNMLETVFVNLITNTLKYSKASAITIKANSKEIIYSDNGVGIPEEHIQYIFERFYRVEKSRSRSTGGLGLGLSIVKEIVEAQGWEISVSSDKKKGGVEFRIRM